MARSIAPTTITFAWPRPSVSRVERTSSSSTSAIARPIASRSTSAAVSSSASRTATGTPDDGPSPEASDTNRLSSVRIWSRGSPSTIACSRRAAAASSTGPTSNLPCVAARVRTSGWSTSEAASFSTRSRISAAAARVKVVARIVAGSTPARTRSR